MEHDNTQENIIINPEGFRKVCVVDAYGEQIPCVNCYVYNGPCANCETGLDVVGYTNISFKDILIHSILKDSTTYEEFCNICIVEYSWDTNVEKDLIYITLN